MKPTIVLCLAIACEATVASSALAAETGQTWAGTSHHERHADHHVYRARPQTSVEQAQNEANAPPASSWLSRLFPNVRPYPPGQGDVDGLSRNIEDCNKGCIGIPTR